MAAAAPSTSPCAPCCKKHGLEDKRDYTMLEGPLPAMPAMLLEKKADLDPGRAAVRVQSEAPRRGQSAVRPDRSARHHADDRAGPRASPSSTRTAPPWSTSWRTCCVIARWFLDPKNHDEVAKIASKITKVPPERFGWLFTKQDTYRDPNLLPNLEALAAQRRHRARSRLREEQDRRQEIRRPEPGAGSGQASQIAPAFPSGAIDAESLPPGSLRCARAFAALRLQMRLIGMAPRKSRLPSSTPQWRTMA